MTDREERQHVIEVLKSWDGYFIGYTSDEVQEALRYAIASIKTDLKYDLLYEETSGQADKQADKSTTKNDLVVDWENYKDVDGNSLDDLILEVLQNNFDCGNTYGYKVADEIIELLPSVTPHLSSGLDKNSKKLEKETTKNDLVVDKEQLKSMIRGLTKWYVKRDNTEVGEPNTAVGLLYDDVMFGIDRLSSVTPQEPKTGHCKNCKFFELNSWAACGGIPIIVAHEICKAWGEGCKTKVDGYCFLFEPKESEDKEQTDDKDNN